MLSSAYVGAIAVCSILAFLILTRNTSENITRYQISAPEKNLVHPERSLPRRNTFSLLLRAYDRVQADVDVLLLPAEFKRLKTWIFYGQADQKGHNNNWVIV